MYGDSDYLTATTGDIVVSAYPELIDSDNDEHMLWGYCMRIENNSNQPITLVKKELCMTDENGKSFYDSSIGFNGEIPDLQPGEYFEYEETAQTEGLATVIYGFCSAVALDGTQFKINFPVIDLNKRQHISIN